MSLRLAIKQILNYCFMVCLLSSCFHPPYNNFRPDPRTARYTAVGAGVGAAMGAVATSTVTGAGVGAAIGGAVGLVAGTYRNSKSVIIRELQKQDIQYVSYGDTMSLIIPTDKYFLINSPRLREVYYPGLNNIVRLLKNYPNTPFYVAGFTDDVGTRKHQQLMSQAQADAIITFLWANGIKSYQLKAEGYGSNYAVSDNFLIHGSAQNRRVEIQWFYGLTAQDPTKMVDTWK